MIPLVMKYAEIHKISKMVIILMNYLIASLVSGIIFLISHPDIQDLNQILLCGVFGIAAGFVYYFGLVIYQRNVQQEGVGKSTLFLKLGMILPIILSIIIFQEFPTWIQTVGLMLAIIAIIMFNGGVKNLKEISIFLLFQLLLGGTGDFINKTVQILVLEKYSGFYLFNVFFTAFCCSGISYLKNKPRSTFSGKNILLGTFLGIPNMLTSFFLILALGTFPAHLVFPVYNVSTIIVASILSGLCFHEIIPRKSLPAYFIALVSLVLMAI
jgi:drug/metabolite transporter (DMT)-like permease